MTETTISTISSTTESNSGSGSGSGSGDESDVVLEKWKSIVIAQVIYLSFVAVAGTIANLIVIFRGLRYKNGLTSFGSHRSAAMDTTNMLVISLAVSNLGTSTFSVGIFIFPMYVPNTPINDFTCRFIWPLRELFTAVACYAFTFIAVGRYLILFRSFRNTRVFSSPVANNIALWVFSYVLFALPFAAAYKPINLNGTWLCDTYWEKPETRRAYITFLILFNSFVPTFLVSISYMGIMRRLKSSRNVVAPTSTMKSLPDNQEALSIAVHSHRAARISLLLLISFVITFIPYGVLLLCVEYKNLNTDTFPQLEKIYTVAFCLLHAGAIMDPLIIMLSSSTYRPDCGLLKRYFSR
jgi:hypothetical protein